MIAFAAEATQSSQAWTFGLTAGGFALLTIVYQTFAKRKDKRLDDLARREDKRLADEADEAKEARHEVRLREVEAQAAEVARLLAESNERVAEGRSEQMVMLKGIETHQVKIEDSQDMMHAMLNSAQTTQMIALAVTLKSSRASLRTQYEQLKELAYLRLSPHQALTKDTEIQLDALQEQIEQLGRDITANQDAVDDRVRAQELAESRERNKTKDGLLNEVSKMVPVDTAMKKATEDSSLEKQKPDTTTDNTKSNE